MGHRKASSIQGDSRQEDIQAPVMAVALLSSHSSTALSDWRRAMISLLLKPWSSASQAGPRPMHISFRPLHVLCSFSQGSPDCMHELRRMYASQGLVPPRAQTDDDGVHRLQLGRLMVQGQCQAWYKDWSSAA